MKPAPSVLACVILSLAFPAAAQSPAELRFGVFPVYDAKTTIRIFQPLADFLSRETGAAVMLVSAEDRDAFLARALAGSYDLLWSNNEVYLALRGKSLGTAIARGEPPFRGIAVVLETSPYRSISGLRGARIAAVSPQSVAGFLFMKALFEEAGMDISRDAVVTFAPKVESIPFLVLSGKVDVGVYVEDLYVRSPTYGAAARRLRVLAYSPPIPQFPFVARAGLDPAIVDAVRSALSRIDGSGDFGRAFLEELRIEKVAACDDGAYDDFRSFYMKAKQ